MNESSYEAYKESQSREQKKRDGFRSGMIRLIVGACMLIYVLWVLPFQAGSTSQLRGDELTGGKNYFPAKVYYIEDLQLLHVKTDAENGQIYAIAQFSDREKTAWIISFGPGQDSQMAEMIRLSPSLGSPSHPISGYFLLKPLVELPAEADSFYTVYSQEYTDAEKVLNLHAEYLCPGSDNYTLRALLRPGIPLFSFVVGLFGVLSGGISLVQNRPGKKEIKEEQL